MPKFDIPNMEVPAAFREFAEKGISQAKENYEKMKSAAEEATDLIEETYATASKGASDYGLKVIENARANTQRRVRSVRPAADREVLLGSGRALDRLYALAVRNRDRAGQGSRRACAEGCDRDRRADQGKLHLRDEEGRVSRFSRLN